MKAYADLTDATGGEMAKNNIPPVFHTMEGIEGIFTTAEFIQMLQERSNDQIMRC